MEKADWECWKKLDERFENNDRSFLFDLDDKDQEDTHRDERIRQRWNVELSQHGQEMDMSSYSPLPPPTVWVPHQDLCSKITEYNKEEDREICKL